ncbi:hypothetical protein B0H11DRAFT_1941683 [Mycena galericulata]|nr:hypothetical protein B0H11DRAFT_1941683 [Mycena galericulata]
MSHTSAESSGSGAQPHNSWRPTMIEIQDEDPLALPLSAIISRTSGILPFTDTPLTLISPQEDSTVQESASAPSTHMDSFLPTMSHTSAESSRSGARRHKSWRPTMIEIQDEDPLAVPLSATSSRTLGIPPFTDTPLPLIYAQQESTVQESASAPSAPRASYYKPTCTTSTKIVSHTTDAVNAMSNVSFSPNTPEDFVHPSSVHRSPAPPPLIAPKLVNIVPREITDSTVTIEHLTRNYTFFKVANADSVPLCENLTLAVPFSDLARTPGVFASFNTSQLYQLAVPHGRQVTFSSTYTQLEVLRGHRCIQTCSGWKSLILFSKKSDPQQVPFHTLDIHYCNDAVLPVTGTITTYNLNRNFQLVASGSFTNMEKLYLGSETTRILCRCKDIAQFVSLYLHLNKSQLDELTTHHHLPSCARKPNAVRALMTHACHVGCSPLFLVFEHTSRFRKEPFIPRILPDQISDADVPLKLRSLDDLDVLPMTLSNDILVDVDDGTTFISTYKLNRSFDYMGIVTEATVKTLFSADMDTLYLPAFSADVATFVSLYPHLKVKDLQELSSAHTLKPLKTKPLLTQALLQHKWQSFNERPNFLPLKRIVWIKRPAA